MTFTDRPDATSAPTVRFGRRQTRGLLLGFSALRIATIATALAVFVAAMFVGGLVAMLIASPAWIALLLAAFVPWAGRPAIETVPVGAHFAARHAVGQARFVSRPSSPRPSGTLALPGDAAALRFHVDSSGIAMVHDPHARTLTAVAHVTHPAFVLLAPDDQTHRVNGWSRVLAGVAASGTCARIQILETTFPDAGHGITGWWREHGSGDREQWAVREYEELMAVAAPSASTHRTLVALVLDLGAAGKAIRQSGRGMTGAAAVMRQEIVSFEASLRSAELTLGGWLGDKELARVLRGAYDPIASDAIEGEGVGSDLATGGPMAVEEHWDYLRHDTAFSRVFWITEWPRTEVTPSFLHALIFEQGIRKSLSIVATPLTTAQAMRDIRRQKVEYLTDAAQKAKIGQLADESDAQEYRDVLDRERALIAGHADLTFSGFLAVTSSTKEELDSASSRLHRAAIQCGCEARILFGQQAQAFTVAALPLGRRAS